MTQTGTAIFWPVIVQVALVYAIYVLLSARRMGAIRAGTVKAARFRENRDEPADSLFVRNSLENQFELPTLFYVACVVLYVTDGVSATALVLAWLFVLSRIAHAGVHVTTNNLARRRPLFIVGFFALAALWLLVVWRLLTSAA